jgi:hypothetical protein
LPEVIRGTTTTVKGPGGEFATALQAQQAYNRQMLHTRLSEIAAMQPGATAGPMGGVTETPKVFEARKEGLREAAEEKYGRYVAPGETLYGIRYERPEQKARAQLIQEGLAEKDRQQRITGFTNALHRSDLATMDKSGKLTYVPKDISAARDRQAAEDFAATFEGSPEEAGKAALQHFRDRQLLREWLTAGGNTPEDMERFVGTADKAEFDRYVTEAKAWDRMRRERRAAAPTESRGAWQFGAVGLEPGFGP